jgi:hypothetical protein
VADLRAYGDSDMLPATLYVSNVFAKTVNVSAFRAAFSHYGELYAPAGADPLTILSQAAAATVTFARASDAMAAMKTLHGKSIGGTGPLAIRMRGGNQPADGFDDHSQPLPSGARLSNGPKPTGQPAYMSFADPIDPPPVFKGAFHDFQSRPLSAHSYNSVYGAEASSDADESSQPWSVPVPLWGVDTQFDVQFGASVSLGGPALAAPSSLAHQAGVGIGAPSRADWVNVVQNRK